MLYYITLYYIISYYSCYILLYYNTLHYIMLYYIILYCIMLYYIILYYIINQEVVSTLPTLASLPRSPFVGYDIFSSIIFDHNISSQFNILHKSSQYFPDVSWYSYMSCPRSTHFTWIHPRSGSAGLVLGIRARSVARSFATSFERPRRHPEWWPVWTDILGGKCR